jgi:UDPglucose--hexose-1-phosphate uridylyltransferase
MSELRKDPTRGQWVLVRPAELRPAVGDECPFCPGNEHMTPAEITAHRKEGSATDGPGWSVRVVPEADPYFRIELPLRREGVGLYDTITPRGATELIVESPRHDDKPSTMGEAQWEQVLWMYAERIRDLKGDLAIRDLLVTRRYRHAGSRIGHPYSRLTAIPIIFDETRRMLDVCREYFAYKRRCMYCDIIRQELAAAARVVRATEHFAIVVPYASRSPFEVWILPRQHACAFEAAPSAEAIGELAALLAWYFATLARLVGDPPFEMALYTSPNQSAKVLAGEWSTIAEDYHWHIEVTPSPDRLTRVGGIYINDTPPEDAARALRDAGR